MKVTLIDNNFYHVSDANAGKLARMFGITGKLPRFGYELILHEGIDEYGGIVRTSLQRTPLNRYKRKWVWAIHVFNDWEFLLEIKETV